MWPDTSGICETNKRKNTLLMYWYLSGKFYTDRREWFLLIYFVPKFKTKWNHCHANDVTTLHSSVCLWYSPYQLKLLYIRSWAPFGSGSTWREAVRLFCQCSVDPAMPLRVPLLSFWTSEQQEKAGFKFCCKLSYRLDQFPKYAVYKNVTWSSPWYHLLIFKRSNSWEMILLGALSCG